MSQLLREARCDARAVHLEHRGLLGPVDTAVWAYAAAHSLVLVTRDENFERPSVVRGPPPKVVWSRLGNGATSDVARRRRHADVARFRFVAHDETAFLALG